MRKYKRKLQKYYISGYCEMPQGSIEFRGVMTGLSQAHVRYNLIYAIREEYGNSVWINPIFEDLTYIENSIVIETRNLHCKLIEYMDNKKRFFVPFSNAELKKFDEVREEYSSQIPSIQREEKLPTFPLTSLLEAFKEAPKPIYPEIEQVEKEYPENFISTKELVEYIVDNTRQYIRPKGGTYLRSSLANSHDKSILISKDKLEYALNYYEEIQVPELIKINGEVFDLDKFSYVYSFREIDKEISNYKLLSNLDSIYENIEIIYSSLENINEGKVQDLSSFYLENTYKKIGIDILNFYEYSIRSYKINRGIKEILNLHLKLVKMSEMFLDVESTINIKYKDIDYLRRLELLHISFILKSTYIIRQLSNASYNRIKISLENKKKENSTGKINLRYFSR